MRARAPGAAALFASLALGATASLSAQLTGLTVYSGRLHAVDLHDGTELESRYTGVEGLTAYALTTAPSGEHFAIGWTPGASSQSLYRIEPVSAQATLVGPLDAFFLDFGPGNLLYGFYQTELFAVDAQSAATAPLFDLGSGVSSLLGTSDGLWITRLPFGATTCQLEAVDLGLQTTTLVHLDTPCGTAASDVHEEGDFFFLDQTYPSLHTERMHSRRLDPLFGNWFESGSWSYFFLQPHPEAITEVRGAVSPVQIPTLGTLGAAILATLLAFLAYRRL